MLSALLIIVATPSTCLRVLTHRPPPRIAEETDRQRHVHAAQTASQHHTQHAEEGEAPHRLAPMTPYVLSASVLPGSVAATARPASEFRLIRSASAAHSRNAAAAATAAFAASRASGGQLAADKSSRRSTHMSWSARISPSWPERLTATWVGEGGSCVATPGTQREGWREVRGRGNWTHANNSARRGEVSPRRTHAPHAASALPNLFSHALKNAAPEPPQIACGGDRTAELVGLISATGGETHARVELENRTPSHPVQHGDDVTDSEPAAVEARRGAHAHLQRREYNGGR